VRQSTIIPRGLLVGLAALAVGLPTIFACHYEFQLAPLWYNVIGVDVSNHQGDINWPALARNHVAFAYIKATEGGDFRDKRFQLNWEGAKRAGLVRGAYHFFTQCRSGAEQAKNFIATVPREHGALPPVIDAEHMGPCPTGQQVGSVIREIATLIDALEAHYGRRPVIYTGSEFDAAYLQGQLTGDRFWLRSLFWPPWFRTGQWVIWQFHDAGTRAGINGPVDLNVFRGSWRQFETFVVKEPLTGRSETIWRLQRKLHLAGGAGVPFYHLYDGNSVEPPCMRASSRIAGERNTKTCEPGTSSTSALKASVLRHHRHLLTQESRLASCFCALTFLVAAQYSQENV
jgi:lysozyme